MHLVLPALLAGLAADLLEERHVGREPASLGHESGDVRGHGEDDELATRERLPDGLREVPAAQLAVGPL